MTHVLKSKPVVDELAASMKPRVAALKERGVVPTLAILRVGERPDDLSYERTAVNRAESLGLGVRVFALDAFATPDELEAQLTAINGDDSIHGCLMFRPLPAYMDEPAMCDMMAMRKDVDGVSSASLGAVFTDATNGFGPCTAQACIETLDHYQIPITGKHVVVVGRSLVVGKPVAMMLLRRNASVTICHSRTEDLPSLTRSADIVICATGRAKAFGEKHFRAGQTVIDVGINFDEHGKLCGDVDYAEVSPIVGAITPVPGGIGSVTTSVTMLHTVIAAERSCGIVVE